MKTRIFLLTLAPALVLETAGIRLLLLGTISAGEALAVNLAAALFPAIGAGLLHRSGQSPFRSALISLFTVALPGIGLYGCTMAMLLSKTVIRGKGLAHDLERADYHTSLTAEELSQSKETYIEQELGVEPIVDILRGTDSALKRGAIKVLGSLQSGEAVTLLRRCLKDPDPEIRFYAHTALTDMEENFSRKLTAVEKSRDNEDSRQIQRARILLEYAATGLPGENMRLEILNQARTLLHKAVPQSREPAPLYLELARISLELGDRDSARSFLADPAVQNTSQQKELLSRLLFEERDFPALAELEPFDRPPRPDSPVPSQDTPHA
ncbi:MAG TPA: HEAT repeat domain-containing protein [Desulfomicrobiaceae bacterium]|nr:HEAT repeat domain-containing protein [Desulfomicrobiaceae bacterium]